MDNTTVPCLASIVITIFILELPRIIWALKGGAIQIEMHEDKESDDESN